MMELLSYSFMQHALAAALLCSLACGIIGSLVVLNRLSYLAGAVAHAAYGGIGIAFYSGLPVLPCTMGFSLGASLLMARIAAKDGKLSHSGRSDTAIGMLWAAGMAFGIILIELSPGYAGDLMGFLFGSILAVPLETLVFMAILDGLLILILLCFRQGLAALSLDPEFAQARGLPVRGYFFLLVGMTAVAVVMLLQVVGLILVIALLTIPPHMARQCTHSLVGMMLAAFVLCFAFCLAGLGLAYMFDLSTGAVIIAVATAAYAIQTLFTRGNAN